DTDSGTASTPPGTVSFTSSGAGAFSSPGTSCTLSSGSCSVNFTPSVGGTHTITASYGGDGAHLTSSGTSPLAVNAAINLSPTAGAPGHTVTVAGSYFGASRTSTIKRDGTGGETQTRTTYL